ncbi:MAG: hypothetical protein QNK37_24955 [Acidobacteriota bacterium]|nr:hypothetical protein [Acidobacteriota bacterium]
MLDLVIFVAALVGITLAWRPANGRPRGKRKVFSKGSANPFQGRFHKPPPKPANHTIDKGSMTRCHNCATYFPMGQVVHEVVEGHLLEFCSVNCRNSFLGPHD